MTLDEHVQQFYEMKLPGQPQPMHVGTLRLVRFLVADIALLRKEMAHCLKTRPTTIDGTGWAEAAFN